MARRGPNTAEGKAIVRLNAVRHGIFASDPVVPGVEDPEEWQAFREELIGAFAPVGALEEWWADRVASGAWRLRRIDRFEAEIIAVGQERVERDFSTMARVRTTPLRGALPPGGMSMKDLYDQAALASGSPTAARGRRSVPPAPRRAAGPAVRCPDR